MLLSPHQRDGWRGLAAYLEARRSGAWSPSPPLTTRACAPCAGAASFPKSRSLCTQSCRASHAHSLRTPWRLLDPPTPCASSTHRRHVRTSLSFNHPPHPTPLHAGRALGRRHRINRLLPLVRGLAAADLADAVWQLEGLVRASTPRQTHLCPPHRPTPRLTPPTSLPPIPEPHPRPPAPAAASVQDGRRRGVWPDQEARVLRLGGASRGFVCGLGWVVGGGR